jgi:hypothetical protein
MEILRGDDGKFRILHAGQTVKGLAGRGSPFRAGPFDTERDANSWADTWIDDQVFDSPNEFSPELEYTPAK